jgi:hypothetical protein
VPVGRLAASVVVSASGALYLFLFGFLILPSAVASYRAEHSGLLWLAVVVPVLAAGLVYVGFMYLRDARAVGLWWASFLGLLRASVYVILVGIFLLPALQTWERTEVHSKVLLLVDVSGSMQTTDEQPSEQMAVEQLPSRLDKVAKFLAGNESSFLKEVQAKNPVTLYGFGGQLDEDYVVFAGGAPVEAAPAATAVKTAMYPWFWIFLPAVLLAVPFFVLARFVQDARVSLGRALGFGALRFGLAFLLPLVLLLVLGWLYWPEPSAESVPAKNTPVLAAVQKPWTEADWAAWFKLDYRRWLIDDLSAEGQRIVQNDRHYQGDPKATPVEWANAWLQLGNELAIPAGLSDEDRARLKAKRERLPKKLELRPYLLNATNLGDSVLAAYNRESSHMLAGIIVISDGRSNQGSAQAFEELRIRAARAKVPVFTIGVGEDRLPIRIDLTDLQAPERVPPDEKFPIRVNVDGVGLAEQEFEVFLDIFRPKSDPKKDRPTVTLSGKGKFKPGEPPHDQVEFSIDPADPKLAALLLPEAKSKPELAEGDYAVLARIPKDRREVFRDKEHVSDPVVVSVVKRPLRILLVAGGPTRDYQFARSLFVRGIGKWCDLSIYLQHGDLPGERVQDVDPERLLTHFPNRLRVTDDPQEKLEEKYYNLAQYDLVIAFDPDWTKLEPDELAVLQKWVETQAGGLVVVAGPIHTFQLVRGVNAEKLKPLLDLYPVILDDSRLQGLGVDRPTTEPWRLNFPGVTGEMEFLKLDDEGNEPLSGWELFFTGQARGVGKAPLRRGFYNYYPVKSAKPGATVIATFSDPRARTPDGKEQPYLVSMPYGNGKVVYIGSGEMWRLRQFREAFHERFWTKLGRFAAAGSQRRVSKRGDLIVGRQFTAGNYVRLEVRALGPSLEPLPPKKPPRLRIRPPAGATNFRTEFDLAPKPGQGEWQGWFQGRFLVETPGEYRLEVEIPESTDVLTRNILVKEANPELDNTRPDFAELYRLAGDLKDLHLDDEALNRVKLQLRPEIKEADADRETPRLFFSLRSAGIVPGCLVADARTQRTRGPAENLWDDGFTLGTLSGHLLVATVQLLLLLATLAMLVLAVYFFVKANVVGGILALLGAVGIFGGSALLGWAALLLWNVPLSLAAALLIVVALLSAEWLTRKLLRLA